MGYTPPQPVSNQLIDHATCLTLCRCYNSWLVSANDQCICSVTLWIVLVEDLIKCTSVWFCDKSSTCMTSLVWRIQSITWDWTCMPHAVEFGSHTVTERNKSILLFYFPYGNDNVLISSSLKLLTCCWIWLLYCKTYVQVDADLTIHTVWSYFDS